MDNEVIVIIGPQATIVNQLSKHLQSLGAGSAATHTFTSAKEALQLNFQIYPTLVFYNNFIAEKTTESIYSTLQSHWPHAQFVAIYNADNEDAALQDIEAGAVDCVAENSISVKTIKKAIALAQNKRKALGYSNDNNEFFKAIINNTIHAVFLTKPDGKIIDANEGAAQMFGYSLDEIKTLTRQHLFDHTDPALINNLKTRQQQGSVKGEVIGIHKNGQRFPCQFSSVLYKTANGEDRANTIVLDITDQNWLIKSAKF